MTSPLRQHGQPFGFTYQDQAHIRRRFKPGTPEYWLGDTPLQKQRIEDRIKSGLVGSEQPRSWRQRLADLLGSKGDDPTALPYVNPRYIPKSKPLPSETEQDSPVLLPQGIVLDSNHGANRPDSPMNPYLDETAKDDEQEDSRQEPESTYALPGDFTSLVPSITRMTPPPPTEDDQAGSSTADPKSAAPKGQRRRNSRPMESQRLELEIVEPEQDESERPPQIRKTRPSTELSTKSFMTQHA
ncbi:hypothetical protein NCS56_00262600 [Fusarium sp. Ph1]|nr:hypothetical protein NCS56_00262600 [Fusarium sp. Ph1]